MIITRKHHYPKLHSFVGSKLVLFHRYSLVERVSHYWEVFSFRRITKSCEVQIEFWSFYNKIVNKILILFNDVKMKISELFANKGINNFIHYFFAKNLNFSKLFFIMRRIFI